MVGTFNLALFKFILFKLQRFEINFKELTKFIELYYFYGKNDDFIK